MGSDRAPEPEVRGAILACRHYDVRVHLVGPEEILRPALDRALRAPRWPGEARARDPHRPLRRSGSAWTTRRPRRCAPSATRRCASGCAWCARARRAASSPPAIPARRWRRRRWCWACWRAFIGPALATILPTVTGSPSLLLDVGANVDCDPDNLVQFAVMGHMYARNVLRIARPRVGLLSIGEEDSKGNQLTRDTLPLLREISRHRLHRQRRGPRPVQRADGRGGVRRICGQRRAEDLRRASRSW